MGVDLIAVRLQILSWLICGQVPPRIDSLDKPSPAAIEAEAAERSVP